MRIVILQAKVETLKNKISIAYKRKKVRDIEIQKLKVCQLEKTNKLWNLPGFLVGMSTLKSKLP